MYLGIETSSLVSSVALLDKNQILGELTIQAGLTHSVQLVPHIDLLLEQTQVERKELEGIVVSIGPGSFTGLRIGLGTAKALAYGLNIPLIGIMTMKGLAHNLVSTKGILSVMIDGQKKNVYEARYCYEENKLICLQEPKIKMRSEALAELAQLNESVIFLGDGAIMAAEEIEAFSDKFRMAPLHLQIPRASSLLMAAQDTIAEGNFEDPMSILPYYLRCSEAEVLWEQKHGAQPISKEPKVTKIIEKSDGTITKEDGEA